MRFARDAGKAVTGFLAAVATLTPVLPVALDALSQDAPSPPDALRRPLRATRRDA